MIMKPVEIVREYKSAKSPKLQITVLADLNCCTKKEICEIIRAAGYDPTKSKLTKLETAEPKKRGRKPKNPKVEADSTKKIEKPKEIAPKEEPKKEEKTENPKACEDFGEVEEIEEIVEPESYPNEVEDTVKEVLFKELKTIEVNIKYYTDRITELNARYEKIMAFIKGEQQA